MDFIGIYHHMTVCFAIVAYCLNLALLPIVLRKSKYALGSFKIIMMVFAVTNVLHITFDVISLPRFYAYPGIMVTFAANVDDQFFGRFCMVSLYALFCAQIFNQFLHFLYRYILLCRPLQRTYLKPVSLSIFLLIVIPIFVASEAFIISRHLSPNDEIAAIIANDVLQTFNKSSAELYGIGVMYWKEIDDGIEINWFDLLEMVAFLGSNFFLIIGMFVFGLLIHLFIQNCKSMSPSALEMHNTVLQMLIVQTVLPFIVLQLPGIILIYGPAVFTLNRYTLSKTFYPLPVLRLQLDVLMSYVLTCPLLEPLVVIYFLSKNRIRRFLRCRSRRYAEEITPLPKQSAVSPTMY